MTPHARAAPPAARDHHIPRRPSFGRSLRESGLPDDYLEALDAKRRQLDDSIWKYIASKEREYKNFEKELRHQRRATQGQEGEGDGNVGRRRQGSADTEQGATLAPESSANAGVTTRVESKRETRETMDRSSMAGLKDRGASGERDKDFVGVFTPIFLPALSNESIQLSVPLERTFSTPEQLLTRPGEGPSPGIIERTNSDSVVQVKKTTRPSQLVLQHRTSSSGSSADGRLTSAMKSPTPRPKRKRVSLAVGDAIVAPSDNVPSSLTSHAPSHSRTRAGVSHEQARSASLPEITSAARNAQSSVTAALVQAEQAAARSAMSSGENAESLTSLSMVAMTDFAQPPASSASKSSIDPDGDLFDLEGEDDAALSPPTHDSDELEDTVEDEEDLTGRVDPASTLATSNPIFTPQSGERYDSTAGLVRGPKDKPDSAVPYLSSSAVTSQMPSKPGFRRPSVVEDPVYRGGGYAAAEREAVETESYGSSFVRPSTKGSFTPGSLGESYMEKNAEHLTRLREDRQRTAQVRS